MREFEKGKTLLVLFATIAATISLSFLIATASFAQTPTLELPTNIPDSLAHRNTASILFDRNLNTFNWIARVAADTSSFGTRIHLNEEYSSNVILIEKSSSSPEKRLQSNQQQLALRLNRAVYDNLSVVGQWSSLIYSDSKAVGLSRTSTNSLLAGVEYTPDPIVTFNPLVGHRWDNQIDTRDRGVSYNLGAHTNNLDLDGYRVFGNAQFQQDRLDPRLLEQHFVRAGAQKFFLGNTRDSIEIGFSKNRREFYTGTTGALESRVERVFSFTNLLDYEFDSHFITSLFVNVFSRGLDKDYRAISRAAKPPAQYNTGIDEFRLDTYVQVAYRDEENRVLVFTRFAHNERNERHFVNDPTAGFAQDTSITPISEARALEQEQTKDNLARRTTLSGLVKFPLSRSDVFAFSGSASILRYDTPSETNNDDRDELLVALSLSTEHNVNQYLDLSLTLEGTMSHIVYLFGALSSNNNINRILRFSPRTVYRPFTWLTTTNTFEVLANYTVYDFESVGTIAKSFSYRQFGWSDSTSLELTSRIGLDFLGYLKLYDRGQLNWRDFSERRENSFVDKTYAIQARYSPQFGATITIGVRYFSQSRYTYDGTERKLDSFLRSFGPTCVIAWRLSRNSEVALRGWYEERRLEGGGERSLANMTLNINITL